MYRRPEVILFDLGKVLLKFSHDQMCRQIAERCGTDTENARQVLFAPETHLPYERGQITTAEVISRLEDAFSISLNEEQILWDLGDIFELNTAMVPILTGLKSAGWRMGILSNTCDAHWHVANRKFGLLNHFFDFFITSFEAGEVKPLPGIFETAIQKANCRADQILFVDDMLENVEGAREAEIDAVLYTSPMNFAADLRRRDVSFNY